MNLYGHALVQSILERHRALRAAGRQPEAIRLMHSELLALSAELGQYPSGPEEGNNAHILGMKIIWLEQPIDERQRFKFHSTTYDVPEDVLEVVHGSCVTPFLDEEAPCVCGQRTYRRKPGLFLKDLPTPDF